MGKKKSGGIMARLGNGRLELLVGAFVGLLGGVMVMLLPIEALQDLVLKARLPDFIPPLDPPLGLKAQIGLAGIVAFGGFLVTWGVMKLVDKAAILFEESDEYEDDDDVEAVKPAKDAPRTRRRDHHPDAPTRAPFSASRDLGLPAKADEEEEEEAAPRRFGLFNRKPAAEAAEEPAKETDGTRKPWRRNREAEAEAEEVPNARLRRFRTLSEVEAPPVVEPVIPVDQGHDEEIASFEPVAEDLPEAEVALGTPAAPFEPDWDEPEEAELEPWTGFAQPEPVKPPEPTTHDRPDLAAAEPPFVAPQPPVEAAPALVLPPVAEPVAAPIAAIEPEPAPFVPQWMVSAEPAAPVATPAPEPASVAAEPIPVPDFRSETIDDLVTRLEQAVARRMPAAAPVIAPVEEAAAPVPVAHDEPAEEEEFGADAMDTRLRSALASLKRFAPQG